VIFEFDVTTSSTQRNRRKLIADRTRSNVLSIPGDACYRQTLHNKQQA